MKSMNESKSQTYLRPYTILVLALICAAAFGTFWSYQKISEIYAEVLPDTEVLLTHYPVAKGKEGKRNIYELSTQKPKTWKNLNEISKSAISAVLASEDGSFYQHKGYDPEAIRKAWAENKKLGRYAKGGSTITQQLVKNVFLSPEKTITRKIREIILAVAIEKKLGKKKILETYLNIAEWGPGVYGIEQAAQTYFGKSASQLTAREGAILAFMLPNPRKYRNSLRGDDGLTEFGQQRVSTILERLWRTGKISDDEYFSTSSLSSLDAEPSPQL